jgi:hypothetical protein
MFQRIFNYFKITNNKNTLMFTWNNIIHTILNGNPAPDKRVEKTDEE